MKIIDLINKKYNEWLEEQVKYYRDKYKFANETTSHNNKSDAFKHAFSSAKLTMWLGSTLSEIITNSHEWNNLKNEAPVEEEKIEEVVEETEDESIVAEETKDPVSELNDAIDNIDTSEVEDVDDGIDNDEPGL